MLALGNDLGVIALGGCLDHVHRLFGLRGHYHGATAFDDPRLFPRDFCQGIAKELFMVD